MAPEKPDFSRTSGAAARSRGCREGNELIERCWLYLYQSGQILTDRQLLLEAGDPERPGQLERWSAAAESGTPSLWCEDGKIYLLVAFPQPKKLGCSSSSSAPETCLNSSRRAGAACPETRCTSMTGRESPSFPTG